MSDEAVRAQTALAAVVSAVPGVSRLYPAGTLVDRMTAGFGSPAPETGTHRAGDVSVSPERIRIRVGVELGDSAAQVCRRVYDVVQEWAGRDGYPDAVIEVTAAGIDG